MYSMSCSDRFVTLALAVATASMAAFSLACQDSSTMAAPEAVRRAAAAHVEAADGRMSFDDPRGEGRLELVFDHVHEGVHETEGGRQVVCVDFEDEAGTLYDVDFYLDDRGGATAGLVVEETVLHKVDGENVLSADRRKELDGRS